MPDSHDPMARHPRVLPDDPVQAAILCPDQALIRFDGKWYIALSNGLNRVLLRLTLGTVRPAQPPPGLTQELVRGIAKCLLKIRTGVGDLAMCICDQDQGGDALENFVGEPQPIFG